MTALTSSRDLPLILTYGLPLTPTVTVEFYEKWYGLAIVQPSGSVEEVAFPDEPEFCRGDESPYADHVPNPRVVAAWARAKGYAIDPLAYEMMIGRWEIEARNNYPFA